MFKLWTLNLKMAKETKEQLIYEIHASVLYLNVKIC